MEDAVEQQHAGFLPVTQFPGMFRTDGVFYAFSRGVSRDRGVTHFFQGCFDPTGCYAFIPGVFGSVGVLHTL
jgi:hypothetical protein